MKRIIVLGFVGVCAVLSGAGLILAAEGDDAPASAESDPIQVASLLPSMPKFTAAAMPMALTADPVMAFISADDLREGGDLTSAVQQYMTLIEQYPDTPQATAADRRMDFLVLSLPEADLDLMEAGYPAAETLTTIFGKTMEAQFYFNRALRLMETDQDRALNYITQAMDLAWDIMQGNHDDPFKSTVVEAYLQAADMTGQGERIRGMLSSYADTIEPNFTSWLIKAMVDGEEPSTDFVTTFAAKDAIKKHYIQMAKGTDDPTEKAMYFTKARDLSRQMLADLDPGIPSVSLAAVYLQAAQALGTSEYEAAIADLENFLATEDLSIKRWVVRYELAMAYVTAKRNIEERLAGVAHFEEVIREGTVSLIDPVINDTSIDEGVRGIVMCFLGHAYLGTGRIVEAEAHYQWVLDYYPKEAHAGDSAEFGIVEVRVRETDADPVEVINRYEIFVDDNPSGSYSTDALARAAKIYERIGDTDGAIATYERITRDYPNDSDAEMAKLRLAELSR